MRRSGGGGGGGSGSSIGSIMLGFVNVG